MKGGVNTFDAFPCCNYLSYIWFLRIFLDIYSLNGIIVNATRHRFICVVVSRQKHFKTPRLHGAGSKTKIIGKSVRCCDERMGEHGRCL